jgi:hypothetical protein
VERNRCAPATRSLSVLASPGRSGGAAGSSQSPNWNPPSHSSRGPASSSSVSTQARMLSYWAASTARSPKRSCSTCGITRRTNETSKGTSNHSITAVGDLLLLDEPAAGLDLAARRRIDEALYEVAAGGVTVVRVTHDLATAQRADHCPVLQAASALRNPASTSAATSVSGTPRADGRSRPGRRPPFPPVEQCAPHSSPPRSPPPYSRDAYAGRSGSQPGVGGPAPTRESDQYAPTSHHHRK